jgi:DnaK suppressor protein
VEGCPVQKEESTAPEKNGAADQRRLRRINSKEMLKKKATKKASGTASARNAQKKAPAKKKAAAKKPVAKKKAAVTKKKAAPAKKVAAKKVPAKKAPAKKAAAKKTPAKKTPAKKTPAKKTPAKKTPAKKAAPAVEAAPAKKKPVKLTVFAKRQHQRLLELRDALVDSMAGVAQDNLRSRAEGSEASAFGMHQADAGSDAYDRDFALNLLSQEQDALYEIEEALKRVEEGAYGICEISGNKIAKARLEAIPFARCTVECQAELERERHNGYQRQSVRSLFGLNSSGKADVEVGEALEEDKK